MSNILLIEDEPIARKGLQTFLQQEGFTVQAVSDGDAALELARTFAPDIVLSDWRLRNSDAAGVLQKLRELHPRLALIVLTGFSEEEVRVQIGDLPVKAILSKPAQFDDLLKVIEEAIEP